MKEHALFRMMKLGTIVYLFVYGSENICSIWEWLYLQQKILFEFICVPQNIKLLFIYFFLNEIGLTFLLLFMDIETHLIIEDSLTCSMLICMSYKIVQLRLISSAWRGTYKRNTMMSAFFNEYTALYTFKFFKKSMYV